MEEAGTPVVTGAGRTPGEGSRTCPGTGPSLGKDLPVEAEIGRDRLSLSRIRKYVQQIL